LRLGEIARRELGARREGFEDDVHEAVIVRDNIFCGQRQVYFKAGHGTNRVIGRRTIRGGISIGDDGGFVVGGVGESGVGDGLPGGSAGGLDGRDAEAGEGHFAEKGVGWLEAQLRLLAQGRAGVSNRLAGVARAAELGLDDERQRRRAENGGADLGDRVGEIFVERGNLAIRLESDFGQLGFGAFVNLAVEIGFDFECVAFEIGLEAGL